MGYAVAIDTFIHGLREHVHTGSETHATFSLWLSSAKKEGGTHWLVLFVGHVKYSFSLALCRMTGCEGK